MNTSGHNDKYSSDLAICNTECNVAAVLEWNLCQCYTHLLCIMTVLYGVRIRGFLLLWLWSWKVHYVGHNLSLLFAGPHVTTDSIQAPVSCTLHNELFINPCPIQSCCCCSTERVICSQWYQQLCTFLLPWCWENYSPQAWLRTSNPALVSLAAEGRKHFL